MTSIVQLDHASASYGPFRALFDVTLDLEQGTSTALLGANGAGKSTVARVLSGLVPLTGGSLKIAGTNATSWTMWKRRRAGVLQIPEGRGVFSTLSVEENLKMALVAHPANERRVLLGEIYERYPLLNQRRRNRAGTLSGGQQRLLSLAPALVAPPQVLIVDEPTLGLDPLALEEVYESLSTLKDKGVTMLVIEQQIDRVLRFVDAAVVLAHGATVYSGAPEGAKQVLEAGLTGAVN